MKKRTKFVIAAMVNITWYTIAVLVINYLGKEVQPELTVAFFAAWTAELALLAGLKIKKEKENEDN